MSDDHPTRKRSLADRTLEVIDSAPICGIEQPEHSSVVPRKGPCWHEPDHGGPCSWAVAS